MESPKPEFFKNVKAIYNFCENLNHFQTLEVSYKENGLKLFVYPFKKENSSNYDLLFFNGEESAKRFNKHESEFDKNNSLVDQLAKYDINALMISINENKENPIDSIGYGTLKQPPVYNLYNKRIMDLLDHKDLVIKEFNNGKSSDDELEKLLYHAVQLYPASFDFDKIIDFRPTYTGPTAFIIPVKLENKEDIEAAYMIFPSNKSIVQLCENFANSNEAVEPDSLLLKIKFNKGELTYDLKPTGNIRNYSREEQEEMVINCLKILGNFHVIY